MTYYTPIWALFDHIKRVTGARGAATAQNYDQRFGQWI
jgi:hypothetical protein